MRRVLAINNYHSEDRFNRLKASLSSNGAKVRVANPTDCSASRFNGYDGVVLSGSPDMLSERRIQEKYAGEIEAIRGTKVPLLGICFGLQLVGCAFGSKVMKNGPMIKEYVDTQVLRPDLLFSGLPSTIRVFESHEEVVEPLPENFVLLARSPSSPIAAVKHSSLPIRGLQFHPERNSAAAPHGDTVVANFVRGLG
jgi:GMP synthase-like glutamine amidotransferase